MHTRLSLRLPVTIALLLSTLIAAFAMLAYHEMRALAEAQYSSRVRMASEQISRLLAPVVAARKAEVAAVASDPRIRRALRSPDAVTLELARRALTLGQQASNAPGALELWDAVGQVFATAEAPADLRVPDALRVRPELSDADSVAAGPIRIVDGVVWYDIVAAVRDGGRHLGFVARRRPVVAEPATVRLVDVITNLIGREARFLVGHPATGWTDLQRPAAGPTVGTAESGGLQQTEIVGLGKRMGAAEPIPGSPWFVWVDFTPARVYARPTLFLHRILVIGLLVSMLGAAAGWLLSRPVTGSLSALTDAAQKMAAGDYEQRLALGRKDEIGQLAGAFDRMAAAVKEGHHSLERQVAERTRELEQTLGQLAGSEQQFRALASSSGAAIVTADHGGSIVFINEQGERMFGYDRSELIGRPFSLLLPERERPGLERRRERLMAVAEQRRLGRVIEVTARRKDGTEFPVELSLASWVAGSARLVGGVMRDISERRAMQFSLEERAQRLEAANRELAAFSYSVSHDLRAPLRALQGFSEALLEDYGDKLDARGNDYLNRVSAAAGRMGRLIDELLELSRVSRTELRRERVSLVPLVAEAFGQMHQLEPARQVRLIAHDAPLAFGDERLIALVVQNLVENAWKFTSKVPSAVIEFGRGPGDAVGRPSYYMRDNGAGFDMRYSDKLFGVFQRLHSETDFPGTGVGLAIVQRIILRHGGTVWAEGTPGKGATFHFTLGGRHEPAGTES